MTNTSKFHTVAIIDTENDIQFDFTIPNRYTNLAFLNAGAQGVVVSAHDSVGNRPVAIKKMHEPFVLPISAVRAFREFVLLSSVAHPNIIQTFSVFTPQESKADFKDVYIVMELMQHNLNDVIEKTAKCKIEHRNLSFFIYQILCAVNHLHREGVIHRDLKPSNIVLNDACAVKVLDFGLARLINPTVGDRMTGYVVTRHYRAPEVVLSLPYTEKVDVWSIGCIFAELINHKVLFKGKDRVDQWKEITRIMGTPSEHFVSHLPDAVEAYVRTLGTFSPKSMEEILPDENFIPQSEHVPSNLTAAHARQFLAKMIAIDPNERYTVAQALQDPYVRAWYNNDEVNAPLSRIVYDRDLDEVELSLVELKSMIFDEVKRIESTHNVLGE